MRFQLKSTYGHLFSHKIKQALKCEHVLYTRYKFQRVLFCLQCHFSSVCFKINKVRVWQKQVGLAMRCFVWTFSKCFGEIFCGVYPIYWSLIDSSNFSVQKLDIQKKFVSNASFYSLVRPLHLLILFLTFFCIQCQVHVLFQSLWNAT